MILEEEQLFDWTDMASAFFRGHGKGRMHMSEYFQPADVLKYAFFFNVKKLEANGQNWVSIISIFCFTKYKKYSSLSWLLEYALLHTGRLLHALLWAHSKASVLPTS